MISQKELNSFSRKYFKGWHQPNVINHDPGTSMVHRILVHRVCEWLMSLDYTFYTRVQTKTGEIVDIVCPELPKPFIEIRHSEKEKAKEYSPEYDALRIFVDTDDPFRVR